ncbi:hypothetical protein [Leptotrichia massiliensis]|uniref:hypothetical protein n=1 Tax=Leptotrichia massiliensis TaxID=1852388 RepID=UPI0008D9F0EC|nr:hypothetical protein [Leptotrichia massiliensis]
MKSMRRIFLEIIFLLTCINTAVFAGAEECSVSNAKFQKNYRPISHALLPNNVWRSEKEKELFFNCVRAEKKFVYEIIGKDVSMPLTVNMPVELGPDGTGSLKPGNTRDLKVYPVEVEVEPGKEYIAIIQYLGSMSYAALIPYYSSDAVEFINNKKDIYAGAWHFYVYDNGTVYYPRYWDSIKFKVKTKYSNGKPVKKAIVRFIVSTAYMEQQSNSLFAIMETTHIGASQFLNTPTKQATYIDPKTHKFY